jgi:hypothetical protein
MTDPSRPSPSPTDAKPCTTRPCLAENEGQVIDVEGKYVFPSEPAFAVNRLALTDGTTIVLNTSNEELRRHFVAASDGKPMRIRGRIFTGAIPDRYKIIGRTPEPHLVDLEAVTPSP